MLLPTEVPVTEKRLLSTAEACTYLNIHRDYLRKLVACGEIKAIRRPGLRTFYRYDIRELDRWIDKNNVLRPRPRRW